MSYLMRLVLPDRPGALGAVATALGDVGADITSVDVVQRRSGDAVDDLVIELPPDRLADSLVTAAGSVPGVEVESIRPYAGTIDPHRELEVLDQLATGPDDPLQVLTDGVTRIFRAGWSMVLGAPTAGSAPIIAGSTAAPEMTELSVPWWPPRPARLLDAGEPWAPPVWSDLGTELAVAPLGDGALLVGRPALRWLPAELIRLTHLAGIAATVTRADARS
ncbi:MAG TPA: ACT domain-containing protein [Jatrophihabitantaceae bacterium]